MPPKKNQVGDPQKEKPKESKRTLEEPEETKVEKPIESDQISEIEFRV